MNGYSHCKMAAIIEDLLNEEILRNKIASNSEFIPHFLNFIHSQCNWLTRTPYTDALTVKYCATQSVPKPNKLRDQSKSTSNQNVNVPHDILRPLNSFKDDLKFSRSEFYGSRQKYDKNSGLKHHSKKKDKKYVKLTEVPQTKRAVPNFSDHSEFPLISEISPRGIQVSSLLEKRLRDPTVLRGASPIATNSENYEPVTCGSIQNSAHSLIFGAKNNINIKTDENTKGCNETEENKIANIDNYVMPSFHLVTEKEKLDHLVNIYCSLIDNLQVPNVSVELYFLFLLLTARSPIKDKASEATLLNTVHNCVYFATSVLYKQKSLLEVLDRTTLHMLSEMPYLQEFSDLKDQLYSLCAKKTAVTRLRKSSIQSVSFQADTDNRRNFPNDSAFQTFKKQRDLFYELLRDWKEQHFSPSLPSKGNFSGRVKYIINLSSASTNFAHLARLIQSHLVTAYGSEGYDESSSNEEIAALRRNFPEKFEKLQERFQVPLKGRGPCPPPSFQGLQEFLRDFVEAASSVSLNQHLINSIAAKIVELNQLEFSVLDCRMEVDEILREKFFFCLQSLRTLAKFLGYLVFMPYQNCESLSADIINCQCVLRNTCQPPLNVHGLLLEAMKSHRLILTVPWIVEYLSMMDPVAPHLDYYYCIFCILFKIYKSEVNAVIDSRPMNKHFLRLILGWLFETPNFPISSFFQVNEKIKCVENHLVSAVENLDALEVIDETIIYSYCPYLTEFRVMLEEYLTGIRRRSEEVRKINPVSADNVGFLCIAQLESKLEDNFFHLQSPSVKKTVEFVAERISSKAIQYIRNEIIPSTKENSLIKIKGIIDKEQDKRDVQLNGHLSSIIDENASTVCNEMKNKAVEFAKSFCKKEIINVMPLLLQSDVASKVTEACCDLSYRTSIEKVLHWTKTYVTVDYISVDMKIEIEKLNKTKSLPKRKLSGTPHSTTLTTDFINNLRDNVKELYHDGTVTTNGVLKLLSEVRCFLSNQELLPAAIKIIGSITVDYIVFLLAYRPNVFTEEVLTTIENLWCEVIPHCPKVSNLLCIRNVSFISCSPDARSSWRYLRLLLVKLLQGGRITARELEANCMKIVKQEWSENTLYNFSNFLKELLCWYRMQSSELEFVEIMEWLSWFCEPIACN